MCYPDRQVYGRGRAVVVATGMDTERWADCRHFQAEEDRLHQIALDKLSHTLTILVVVISACFCNRLY